MLYLTMLCQILVATGMLLEKKWLKNIGLFGLATLSVCSLIRIGEIICSYYSP